MTATTTDSPSEARLERRLSSQTAAAADACRRALDAVLQHRTPADRELAAFFAARRHFGGRDRRAISDAVHAVLRWWGWLAPLAPHPGADRDEAADTEAWLPVLAAAAVLEPEGNLEHLRYRARRLGLDDGAADLCLSENDPATRLTALLKQLGHTAAPSDFPLRALAPSWIREELTDPAQYERFLLALRTRPPVWLRMQTASPDAVLEDLRSHGLHPRPHDSVPGAVKLEDARVDLRAVEAYRRRQVEVQDLASQLVGLACGALPGQRWWDACAGAGGKALHLAALMRGRGSVVAGDPRAGALRELERRARAAGLGDCIRAADRGARQDRAAPREEFDGVLIDAPCTGSGAWRRNAWARLWIAREDIGRHAERQRALLESHAGAVRVGGILVYATCSVFRRENTDMAAWFLDRFPGFRPAPFLNPLTGLETDGLLQIWPWDGDCDSLFVARFLKTG